MALEQVWTTNPRYPSAFGGLGTTLVGQQPELVQSDGDDIWVASTHDNSVSRVRASDGKLLDTWTLASNPGGVLVAMGRVFVAGFANPGQLYMIDPTGVGGAAPEMTNSGLGALPLGIAFDGNRIWTANLDNRSVSIVTPGMTTPWSVTTVSLTSDPFDFTEPIGILFDGSNIWVTDQIHNTLDKLDQNGVILQKVNVGNAPRYPVFDGTNIWVPNNGDNTVTVVRAATGAVVATLSFNGLNGPNQAAFDGQRILVTNFGGNSVSLWRAADLTPVGTFSTGASTSPLGACSDGTDFWIALNAANQLARF
jgi:DNA-binding beta-propeller fold protein YncE